MEFAFDNPKHSDYTLVLKSKQTIHKTIHVSNLVLSSHSKYFMALFTNQMKETHQKEVEIELSSYESSLFYEIIKSLYTGQLSLPSLSSLSFELEQSQQTQENENENKKKRGRKPKKKTTTGNTKKGGKGKKRKVDSSDEKEGSGKGNNDQSSKELDNEEEEFPIDAEEFKRVRVYVDVMKLLDRFSIEKRFSHCVTLFNKENRSIQSGCFQLSVLSDLFEHIAEIKEYKNSVVDSLLKEYINFDQLWSEKEFLQLPFVVIHAIFQRDDLLVSCEQTVLQALRKWINHKPTQRIHYLPELISLVRMTQIKFGYLADYVMGYDCFFDFQDEFKEVFKLFQKYLNGAIRYHSLNLDNTFDIETGCFQEKTLPSNWLQKRVGYKVDETSETIDWECDLDEAEQLSELFYFRGVFYHFNLVLQDDEHYFCIEPNRLLTSGEDDGRYTNVNIKYTISAFNYQTNTRDYLRRDFTVNAVNIGYVIDEKLKLNENTSPYIKPNAGSKRMVHLFASIKSYQ